MESTFTNHTRNAGLEIRKGVVWQVGLEGTANQKRFSLYSHLLVSQLPLSACQWRLKTNQIDELGKRTGLAEPDLSFPLFYLGARCRDIASALIFHALSIHDQHSLWERTSHHMRQPLVVKLCLCLAGLISLILGFSIKDLFSNLDLINKKMTF